MSLSFRQIGHRIGSATLLDDVSFAVEPGELVVVIGPNGAGKSTLVRIASRELTPSSGEVVLCGKPLSSWSATDAARHRAVMPQSCSIAFDYLTHEIVMLGRTPWHGLEIDREIVRTAIGMLDLEACSDRRYSTLSGGEQQRVHFARVVAQVWENLAGSVFLLDEPTSSLDLAHQRDVLRIARDLTRRGAAVLAVLHDLNLAACYADRIALLARGRLVDLDTPARLLTPERLQNAYGVECLVTPHPARAVPLVVPLP
jgi:iron complex transport system ATP-binding protein